MIRLWYSLRNYIISLFIKDLWKTIDKRKAIYERLPDDIKLSAANIDPVVKILRDVRRTSENYLITLGVWGDF